jgi:outer membrane receptor for ferrienterochelin and colicin
MQHYTKRLFILLVSLLSVNEMYAEERFSYDRATIRFAYSELEADTLKNAKVTFLGIQKEIDNQFFINLATGLSNIESHNKKSFSSNTIGVGLGHYWEISNNLHINAEIDGIFSNAYIGDETVTSHQNANEYGIEVASRVRYALNERVELHGKLGYYFSQVSDDKRKFSNNYPLYEIGAIYKLTKHAAITIGTSYIGFEYQW